MDADGGTGAERQAPLIPSDGGNGRRSRRDPRDAAGARVAAGRRSSRSPRRPGSVAERHDIAQRQRPFPDIEAVAEPRIVRRIAAEPEGDVVGRMAQPQVEAACGAARASSPAATLSDRRSRSRPDISYMPLFRQNRRLDAVRGAQPGGTPRFFIPSAGSGQASVIVP